MLTNIFLAPVLVSSLVTGAQDAEVAEAVIELGPAEQRYHWVSDWLQLPDGMKLGNTHGCVVVARDGRVIFNTDADHAIVALNPDGTVAKTWGAEWKGGLHGMAIREEDGEEFLYLAHTGRHEAAKTDLDGKVIWTLPWPEASGKYTSEKQYKPTAIAVAPDGRIFVADGYGQGWIHRYSKDREYLGSFGGPGTEPGKVKTPHGLIIERTDKGETWLVVCDRENRRLQRFDLDGGFVRVEELNLARPCSGTFLSNGVLVTAELAGRVSLLGLNEKGERVVLGHLGAQPDPAKRAQNGIDPDGWKDGEFLSPHGVGADAAGNLYVLDWNRNGRVTKLERVVPLKTPEAPKSPNTDSSGADKDGAKTGK